MKYYYNPILQRIFPSQHKGFCDYVFFYIAKKHRIQPVTGSDEVKKP